jgi:hypothetical protein
VVAKRVDHLIYCRASHNDNPINDHVKSSGMISVRFGQNDCTLNFLPKFKSDLS